MSRGSEQDNNRPGPGSAFPGQPLGLFPWPSTAFPGPISTPSSGSAPGSTTPRRSPSTPRPGPDPDRILLFMIIDYLKRKGMTSSVNQLISEARIDPANPDTIELVGLMEAVGQLHGRNPQPSTDAGFLRDWFGTFWGLFQGRLPKRPPKVDENAIRRTVILTAMQAVGLGGRDPSTLNPDEHRLVMIAIQQHAQRAMQQANQTSIMTGMLPTNGAINQSPMMTDAFLPVQPIQPMMGPVKRKRPENETAPPGAVSPTPPFLIQQQKLQLRAAQLQQQQVLAMMQAQTARTIMPVTARKKSESRKPSPPPEMDESALLSFFGTPADWFSVPEENGSMDQLSTSTGTLESTKKSRKPMGAPPVLGEPQPEVKLPLSDPNDLLLVDNTESQGTITQPSTDSGYFLSAIADLGQHAGGAKAVTTSFSHDGALIASGGHDRRVMIFSTMDRTLLFVLEGHHAQQITQVRFSPTGPRRLLATASFDKTVHIWNLDYDKERPVSPKAPIMVLKEVHEEPVWSIDFISSPNGLRLCSIDASGKLAIWDIDSGTALYTTTIKTPDDRAVTVRQLKAAPIAASHPSILAIANGTHVELFDCGATLHVASLLVSASVGEQKGKAVVALCWGDQSSGETLVTTTVDSIAVWDLSALLHGSLNTPVIPLAVLSVPADKLTCCTHLDGRVVIGGYQTLYLWEVGSEGRERSVRFPAHDGLVVSVSRSAGMLASASHDGWVKLWQLEQTDDRI